MQKIFDTSRPDVKYLITDDKNNPYVEDWIWDVCADAASKSLSHLDDNPFTANQMYGYNRDYTAIYLLNDRPTYGYFFKKTPQVSNRLVRKIRAYNIDQEKFQLGIKFWKMEKQLFVEHLKPFFKSQDIDIVYFTRHVEANGGTESKWLNQRHTMKMGYIMHTVSDIMIKGFRQNVHYYSVDPTEPIYDHTFVLNFNKI